MRPKEYEVATGKISHLLKLSAIQELTEVGIGTPDSSVSFL